MAANSGIEWTEATWNCLSGCDPVSPGCKNCYAKTMTRRLEAMGQADYTGLTNDRHFNGVVRCLPHKLDIPLKRKKPTMYFVNSMSDLFHEDVPDEFIDKVFTVMALASFHTFQVLTKRAERMADYCCQLRDGKRNLGRQLESLGWECIAGRFAICIAYGVAPCSGQDGRPPWKPFPNVWLGVSVEDLKRKDRIDWLRKTPAAVRFLSCEPLLEDLGALDLSGIGWCIVGGESGGGARPCNVDWIRGIVAQCKAAGVACFVKQLGSRPLMEQHASREARRHGITGSSVEPLRLADKKGGDPSEWPEELRVREMPCAVA